MANDNRKYVGLQVKLEGKDTVKKELQDIFKYVNENKNIKLNIDTSSLNGFKESLTKIESEIGKLASSKINIGQDTTGLDKIESAVINIEEKISNNGKTNKELKEQEEQLKKVAEARKNLLRVNNSNSALNIEKELKSYDSLKNRVNEIKNGLNSISNIKMTTTNRGQLESAIITYKTQLGQTVTETMKLVDKTNKAGEVIGRIFKTTGGLKVTDNISQQEKQIDNLKNKYDQLLAKINQFKDKGTFTNSVFAGNSKMAGLDSMVKNIDLSNIEKATTQIKEISTRVEELSQKVTKINTLNSAMESFKNSYNNLITGDNKQIFATLDKNSLNEYKSALNEISNMQKSLKAGNGNNITFKNIENSISDVENKLNNLQNQFSNNLGIDKMIAKAQNSLSKLQLNSSQLNPEVLSRLQQQFNSFNTNTAKSEIQNFIDTTSQLQKTDNNIVKVQNSINKFKNSLDGLKGKYGNLVGNSDSINQLTTFENKIKELESLLTRLKSGNFVNSNSINSTINSANNSFKELTNSVKTSSSAFKLAQQDSISFGQAMQNTLSKFGIYTSLAIACRKVFQEIKEGIQYVKYLDESFTDMSMTMSNLTQNQFNEMGKQLDEMAKKMGVTIEAVHDIGKILPNLYGNI